MNTKTKRVIGILALVTLGALVWSMLTNQKVDEVVVDGGDGSLNSIPPATEESAPLIGTIWTALSIADNSPLSGTTITTQFDDQGRVTGSDGCNTFSSSYTIDGSGLTIDPAMVSTKKACSEDVMTQADAFTEKLLGTTSFVRGDGILVLYQGEVSGLEFTGQSNSLAKTTWNVTGYNNGNQAVVSPIIDTTLTITFGDDGTVSGNSGCNTYSGRYSLNGQTITIGPLATTLRECVEPAGVVEQESAFMSALEAAASWQIQGNQLSLRTAEDALAITALNTLTLE